MSWNASVAKTEIFSGSRIDEDENPIKSKCSKYFLKVDKNGTKRGDYHYPIGSPSKFPSRDGMIVAYRYAIRFDPQLLGKIKSLGKRYGITFPAITHNSNIIINRSDIGITKDGQFIKVPLILMRTGEFNGVNKIASELKDAVNRFNHRPITIFSEDTLGHPQGGMVTNLTKNIGEVVDATWNKDYEYISGFGLFNEGQTPDWLLTRIYDEENSQDVDKTLGISAAYYADIFDDIEYNYIIDNISILEGKTAVCEPPACGLNLNEDKNKESEIIMTDEDKKIKPVTNDLIKVNTDLVNVNNKLVSEVDELKEVIKTNEKLIEDMKVEMETDKKSIEDMNVTIGEIELAKKSNEFRSRFPEEIDDAKYGELLKEYLADPSSIMTNAKLNETYLELVTKPTIESKADGKEYASGSGILTNEEAEEKEFAEVGVPSVEDIMKEINGA